MTTIPHSIDEDALDADGVVGPPRVLFLHRDLAYHGGVPKCFLYLTENNEGKRLSVNIASFQEPSSEMASAFNELGIDPLCLGDNGYLRPAARLRAFLKERNIDVVVAGSFKSFVAAKMASIGLGTRVIFWLHAWQGVMRTRTKKWIFRLSAKRDTLIFVSEAVRDAHFAPGHQGGMEVIYNGVQDPMTDPDVMPYPQSMREAHGIPSDGLVICYTGAFVPWKDHEALLRAFRLLDHRRLNPYLMLVGEGRLLDEMKQLAQDLGCADRVKFMGARTDARRLLGLADMYVHTCRYEGFGLAVVEAMLAGIPVVATDEGALPEYIKRGQTGLLFTPGNVTDLADRITEMADNPQRARQMAAEARALCLEKFCPGKFVDNVCRTVERVARNR